MKEKEKKAKEFFPKVSAKGYGFWKVRKAIQRGIKFWRILRVDDTYFEVEHFGRVEFARRFVKCHNEDIQKALSLEASRQLLMFHYNRQPKKKRGKR